MGTGPAGLAGAAGFAAAGAAGLGADAGGLDSAGAEGAAATGFSVVDGAADGALSEELELGCAGAVTFSAVGLLSPSGGGGAGDLVSSAILCRSVWRNNSRETIGKVSLLTACQYPVNDPRHIDSTSGPRSLLITLDQLPDALRVCLAMSVAGDRIGSARGLNHDIRPENAG